MHIQPAAKNSVILMHRSARDCFIPLHSPVGVQIDSNSFQYFRNNNKMDYLKQCYKVLNNKKAIL